MNQGRTVFSQLISFLPDREFRRCVERYQGDLRLRGFTCWDQYLAMAFAQLTYRDSLRDIEACLRSLQGKLYHLGFRGKVARSTLADANESRDWRIFADFARRLIATVRGLYVREPMGVDLEQTLYALIRQPSICVWLRFRGPDSGDAKLPSRYTRCWTCAATFQRLFALPMARCMTSICSTRSCRKPEPSILWIGATSISNGYSC
jgi:Domain of unknown function (DUF4372)